MASIGPQLPPHLQKRKRTPDDEELGSPPPKFSRRDNDDEILLDDGDSDGDFGPRVPASANNTATEKRPSRPAPAVGPTLPPTVATSSRAPNPAASKKQPIGPTRPLAAAQANNDEISLDSDSDDEAGPAPPPTKSGPAPPPKRVLGPAPPPAPLSERPSTRPDADSSEDDDDWGPALPGSSAASRAAAAGARHAASTARAEPAAPKRDDWMLAPPTSDGPRAPDPTKLKSRKFASGPRAATEGKPAGVSSIWTETPEEKARRLANAVLGREDPNNPSAGPPNSAGRPSHSADRSRADDARVRSYTEQTRGKSLVEQHQAARAAGKSASASASASAAPGRGDGNKWGSKAGGEGGEDDDDDPSKRAFDWEKDMKVGGRISGAQKKELLNRAANFGGRFQSGKYL